MLTDPQRRALSYLAGVSWASPAEIGQAMAVPDARPIHRRAQGDGRIGGAMAHRLIKRGYVVSCSHERGGFPAYRITPAGRRALENQR